MRSILGLAIHVITTVVAVSFLGCAFMQTRDGTGEQIDDLRFLDPVIVRDGGGAADTI